MLGIAHTLPAAMRGRWAHRWGVFVGLTLLLSCSPAAPNPSAGAGPASGAATLLTPNPAPARQIQPVSVRLDWLPHAAQSPLHLAVQRGWFAERALDVELHDGNGSAVTVQTVGAGKFDLGHANLASMAIGHEQGVPVRSVAGFIRKSDLGVLFAEGAPIRTPRDLEGKSVVFTAGSIEGPFIDAFFRTGGTSSDRVNLLSVDAAAKISTYVSGRADAVITPVPREWVLAKKTRPSSYLLFSDYGLLLPGFGLFTTDEVIDSKPEMVRSFVETAVRAWQYASEHPGEAIDAMITARPEANLDRQLEEMALETYRTFLDTERTRGKVLGWQSGEDWADTLRAMADAGLANTASQPADFFTNSFIPER